MRPVSPTAEPTWFGEQTLWGEAAPGDPDPSKCIRKCTLNKQPLGYMLMDRDLRGRLPPQSLFTEPCRLGGGETGRIS